MNDLALRGHIRLLLENTLDFYELTSESRGVFPLQLRELISEESQGRSRVRQQAALFSRQYSLPSRRKPACDPELPVPHPLDADWRFSIRSAKQILEQVCRFLQPGDPILLVATPTLARVASILKLPFKFVFASRMLDPVTLELRRLCPGFEFVDIEGDLATAGAKASIIDPPWYDEVALPMIRKALRGTLIGGQVYVCVPDVFTACSSAPILTDVRELGALFATHCEIEPLIVRYETPYFELNALRAARLTNVHPQWRTAQLVRLSAVATRDDAVPTETLWTEISLGTSRIRVCESGHERKEPSSFIVLNTVSRAAWKAIAPSVVTSGNRFSCGPATLDRGRPQYDLVTRLELVAAREQHELNEHISRRPLKAYSPVDKRRWAVRA